ncbi:MAG TPA: ASCH domain-containing protein [Candidatus Saccharimonadales bacterium]|jgi:hypothetical protein|nr:ASCH domain-containing protein [Candidatus Saccharimonadales bacterium]
MKVLKFRDYLVPLVVSGEKDSTWRLFDDKDLTVGDDIELRVLITNKPFAKAKITKVIEKRFGDFTENDKQGHEKYNSNDEMYAEYTKYYKVPVDSSTIVKIIWFELEPGSKAGSI